jgi:hypothetical protein
MLSSGSVYPVVTGSMTSRFRSRIVPTCKGVNKQGNITIPLGFSSNVRVRVRGSPFSRQTAYEIGKRLVERRRIFDHDEMTGAGNALEPSPFNAIGDSLGKRWLRSVRRQTG